MRTRSPEPTLDAIEHDPASLTGASLPELVAVLERAETVAARLRVRVMVAAVAAQAPASGIAAAERAVRIAEAARLLGMSRDSLHRKWRALPELGGYVDEDHRVKFPLSALEAWIRARR